jgi:hypothetical protein
LMTILWLPPGVQILPQKPFPMQRYWVLDFDMVECILECECCKNFGMIVLEHKCLVFMVAGVGSVLSTFSD